MKCASFDVFDTCLARQVAAPSEVFRSVGHRLSPSLAGSFVEWRCEAERRARAEARAEDVTLEEIWRRLRALAGPCLGAADPRWELEAEGAVIGAIGPTQARIQAARDAGRRIIFISDTYLPAGFLEGCLSRLGFLRTGEKVYASGEIGKSKRTGSLFRHVLEAEGLTAADLSHFGDDPVADGESPRRLGVQAELRSVPEPSEAERMLLQCRPSDPAPWLRAAAAVRFVRVASSAYRPAADPGIRALVEGYFGPIFCLFGHWLLRRARVSGAERLYFASRDARLAWAACRELATQGGVPVDCRYLHISRRAVYLASASARSPEGMPWLCHATDPATPARLAGKLELTPGRLEQLWQARHPGWAPERPLASPAEWDSLWDLLNSRELGPDLEQAARERRLGALAHFRACGLLDPVNAALVDLGSLLYCQEALNRIAAEARGAQPIGGLYLYLKRGRRGPAEAGPAEALFVEDAHDLPPPQALSWLGRTAAVEHLLGLADHPSVEGYDAEGRVRFAPAPPTVPAPQFRAIEAALVDYAAAFGPSWEPLLDDPTAPSFLAALLQELVERPAPAALAALLPVSYPADPAHRQLRRLIEPIAWEEIARELALPGADPLQRRIWPEGSLRATPLWRRRVQHLVAMARGPRLTP